ncbi:MAG: hypothetical protein PVG03_09640 [Desulfarculaceae bacterium]|jgi:hypothetical protein
MVKYVTDDSGYPLFFQVDNEGYIVFDENENPVTASEGIGIPMVDFADAEEVFISADSPESLAAKDVVNQPETLFAETDTPAGSELEVVHTAPDVDMGLNGVPESPPMLDDDDIPDGGAIM